MAHSSISRHRPTTLRLTAEFLPPDRRPRPAVGRDIVPPVTGGQAMATDFAVFLLDASSRPTWPG